MTVVVPAAVSVVLVIGVLEEPLLPLRIATNNRINTAPPTIHTQGAVHHSVLSVVVVLIVVDLVAVSCPRLIRTSRLKIKSANHDLHVVSFNDCFIIRFFVTNCFRHCDFNNCANWIIINYDFKMGNLGNKINNQGTRKWVLCLFAYSRYWNLRERRIAFSLIRDVVSSWHIFLGFIGVVIIFLTLKMIILCYGGQSYSWSLRL